MTIATLDDYINSAKQGLTYFKQSGATTVFAVPFGMFNIAGNPGAGTLAGTSTTAGVVPDQSTAGCPSIVTFGATTGYLGQVMYTADQSGTLAFYDLLWKGGAYAFNSNVTLASQPSFSARVPGGTNFGGLQIWLETVTNFTGNQSIAITYTNQAGTAGKTTGTIATGAAPIVNRMFQMPLASGDSGVQKIEVVTSSVATVGTFNVLVLRPLWRGTLPQANLGDTHGLDKVGLPTIFSGTAFYCIGTWGSTNSGQVNVQLTTCNL